MGIFSSIRDAVFGAGPDGRAAASAEPHLIEIENRLDTMPGADRLNWRTSIVDLMTLIGVESSLEARTTLARELGYDGPLDGSPEMDLWLHRRTMQELTDHSGTIPAEFRG